MRGSGCMLKLQGSSHDKCISVSLKDTSTGGGNAWKLLILSLKKKKIISLFTTGLNKENRRTRKHIFLKSWRVYPSLKDEYVLIWKKKITLLFRDCTSEVYAYTGQHRFILVFFSTLFLICAKREPPGLIEQEHQTHSLDLPRLVCFQIIILFLHFLFIKTCPWSHIADGAL